MSLWVPLTPQSVSLCFFVPIVIGYSLPHTTFTLGAIFSLFSVPSVHLKHFAGNIGVLLTGRTIVSCSDVLYVHCVSLATMMTSNTGQLFLLGWLAGKAYLYRQCEHSDPFILVVITSERHTKRETDKAILGGTRTMVRVICGTHTSAPSGSPTTPHNSALNNTYQPLVPVLDVSSISNKVYYQQEIHSLSQMRVFQRHQRDKELIHPN